MPAVPNVQPANRLPTPSPELQTISNALQTVIRQAIREAGGWLSFADYMNLALYTPNLGYYSGAARKFGTEGDFITAPELTPLFGQALARQIAPILAASAPMVLEAGAGSGQLAADLLIALDELGCPVERYEILELSGELAQRQRQTLAERAPHHLPRVRWLDRLPERLAGCIVGNELLDALPVHVLVWRTDGLFERGVGCDASGAMIWRERPAAAHLQTAAAALPVSAPYVSEVGLAARAWVAEWGRRLERGALLLIDYGLPRRELYHPQRDGGTLRCHYRQRSHDDPFWWPGLNDITVHVDFTAIAEAGHAVGLQLLGYSSQATFLIGCGLIELLQARQAVGGEQAVRALNAVQVLLSPNEMGELFKVIALGRGLDAPLAAFARGDLSHTL